jgi:predicted transcriptional regulator
MITAAGSYTALRDGFSGIGGTNISSASMMVQYWTRTRNTEYFNLVNWTYDFSDITHGWQSSDQGGTDVHVRLCLQFNIPIPTHTAALADGTPTGWSITPTTPEEGSTVTVSYTGQHRVKSVKVVKKVAAKTLAEATLEDIGKIAGKDGKIYATKADAEAVATGNAVAMIAYVGTASDCAHGLAIALADESGTKNYGAAGTACSGKAAVTGGTWRLPSDKDWQYMFIGCGSSESYSAPTYDPHMSKSYSGLASKLTTAQGAALQSDFYWSSTETAPGSSDTWGVVFNGSNATFYMDAKTEEHQVRACLAF